MKAMILAAGLGTRLKPLTDNMPKALVPIAGEPMLKRVINQLKQVGFKHIVINVHHFAGQITDYLKANNNFDINIDISNEESQLLDTGGGVLHAQPLFTGDNSFLVHNVDILSNCDLKKLCETHSKSYPNAHATMLVSDRYSTRKLLFDNDNRLCGWINKLTGETKPKSLKFEEGKFNEYAFSGIQVINVASLELMKKYGYSGKFSIIQFYMDMLEKEEIEVYGYVDSNLKILDIGKPETLIEAESFLKEI